MFKQRIMRFRIFSLAVPLVAWSMVALCPARAQQGGSQGSPGTSSAIDDCDPQVLDSPYVPVDSWIYPAVMRLYSLGYLDTVYVGMRPWTRANLQTMLDEVNSRLEDEDLGPNDNDAAKIYEALSHELRNDTQDPCAKHVRGARVESVYSVERAISGTPLRDSYHLGSTIVNDYGRPYSHGFNDYSGASGYVFAGRFLVYARGEFEGAASTTGYSATLAATLASIDGTTNFFNPTCWISGTSCTPIPYNQQATIPAGPIGAASNGRLIEAYASARYAGHEISFGKQDDWLGPGLGGGMAYSNNAENIYSFRINRTEPLHIPWLSDLLGPFRYDFLVGSLKGHTYPRDPWVHIEKVSFRPDSNIEFGFERTVIWGGKGHAPITLHSFLRSFFSLSAPTAAVKDSTQDPGARFGAFDFSWRLPFVRNWLTLYTDSEAHDDVSPIDAPRRAAYRAGLYLSHVPGISKLDVRAEGFSTNPSATDPIAPGGNGGQFMYWENIQRQGYTNKGVLFGDWIGREDKGGQGWITYHLSGNEWIRVGVRNQKAAKDFIEIPAVTDSTGKIVTPAVEFGTTLNDIDFQAVKRIGKDIEVNGSFAYEHWKAPIYLPGPQTVTTTTVQVTWFPERKINF
jgi:hypothetical protein